MTPWVTRLLVANVALYLLAQPGSPLFAALMLIPSLLLFRPWTALTYMFLHGSIMHLLFNMLALYFFGPRLESRLGSRDFILLYLIAGLTGAALSLLLTPHAMIVGASGAIYGVMLGFARFWPDQPIYIYAVLPVPARVLIIVFTLISLVNGLTGGGAGVAHFAHLGGFLGAWVFLSVRQRRSKKFQQQSAAPRVAQHDWDKIDLTGLHEINRQEVERLRAKIAQEGPRSLTPSERDFLNRMATRES